MSHSGCVGEGWTAEWLINSSPSQRGVPSPFSTSSDPTVHHSSESIHQSRRTAAADTFTSPHVWETFFWDSITIKVVITKLLMFFLCPLTWRTSLWWMLMSALMMTALHWRARASGSRESRRLDAFGRQSLSIRLNRLGAFDYLHRIERSIPKISGFLTPSLCYVEVYPRALTNIKSVAQMTSTLTGKGQEQSWTFCGDALPCTEPRGVNMMNKKCTTTSDIYNQSACFLSLSLRWGTISRTSWRKQTFRSQTLKVSPTTPVSMSRSSR